MQTVHYATIQLQIAAVLYTCFCSRRARLVSGIEFNIPATIFLTNNNRNTAKVRYCLCEFADIFLYFQSRNPGIHGRLNPGITGLKKARDPGIELPTCT